MTARAPPDRSEPSANRRRVFVLGATGSVGGATVRALLARGDDVVCLVRPRSDRTPTMFEGATVRFGEATDPASLARDGFCGERFDALVSCMASRTGAPKDAWAVDYRANTHALNAAKAAGVARFVLLSAICVQKPRLAFQQAKLAFERELMDSGLDYAIVRPTAYFKSLCGQLERVRAGKPYLLFGDGKQTACKPISDADLGAYLAACIDDPVLKSRVLPIGGPGPAITPREQGEKLFALTGREPRFMHVPFAVMDAIIWTLSGLGVFYPPLSDKAELARIGRYYATESMLVLDPATGRYDADATPATGKDTLFDHYASLVASGAAVERSDHSVF
ncbi:MAG: NAD(P)H-binding protein [Alphaproteobacteria bacterium]|nr:NAD(P)H-binding protein [Alphaproteobacteria bacterium]